VTRCIRILVVGDRVPTGIGLRAVFGPEPDIDTVTEAITGVSASRLIEVIDRDLALIEVDLPSTQVVVLTAVDPDFPLEELVEAVARSLGELSVDPGSPAAAGSLLPILTEREAEVLELVARGLSNREIAEELRLSLETVKTHVKRTYAKIGARDRAQAVIAAYEARVVVPAAG
jgi:DNA-binding NarL/FixJ family response regulator